MENASDVVVVQDLIYSKVSTQQARWVLVVRDDSLIGQSKIWRVNEISTELVNLPRNILPKETSIFTLNFSWGATEAKVVEGLVDAVVEVTETGRRSRPIILRIIHELMKTNTQLIAIKLPGRINGNVKKLNRSARCLTVSAGYGVKWG